MRFREYPLLNTPNMVVTILRQAAKGRPRSRTGRPAAGAARTGRRAPAVRAGGGGEPAGDAGPLPDRGEASRARAGRTFALTERGRAALAGHPEGFDTADLMVYPEFARYIRSLELRRGPLDPRAGGYDQGSMPTGPARRPPTTPSRPTAPTTSPGRTAGPRRWTRTSAGPARASRASPSPAPSPPPAPPRAAAASAPRVARRLAEPDRPGGGRRQDHRHPVVHGGDLRIGARVTVARFATAAPPGACQRSQTAAKAITGVAGSRIAQRVLRRCAPVQSNRPDRQQAAAEAGIGRFGEERLGAGVDDGLEHRAAAGVGAAHGDQPPAHGGEPAAAAVGDDGEDRLARRCVEARAGVGDARGVGVELPGQFPRQWRSERDWPGKRRSLLEHEGHLDVDPVVGRYCRSSPPPSAPGSRRPRRSSASWRRGRPPPAGRPRSSSARMR